MSQVGSNPHLDYLSGVHLLARVLEARIGVYETGDKMTPN